jgi:hypothetical protein
MLDGTDGAGGKKRREQEEIARRDDDYIVVFSVELLEQGDRAPTSACAPSATDYRVDLIRLTKDNQCLLLWVGLELLSRVAQVPDLISNIANKSQRAEICYPPEPS